jgi:mRNA-degrading endonuclease RelE of RelBE toxin-antitoxin system
MYGIVVSRKAERQLKKIARKDRNAYAEIDAAILTLKQPFEAGNVKKLNNHAYQYRLTVGNYRVLYDVRKEVKIVAIEEVKKRDENTY